MNIIYGNELYRKIWDDIELCFNYPSRNGEFKCDKSYKNFRATIWNEQQKSTVNEIFIKVSDEELYALDWQHICFSYNLNKNIAYNTWWHDEQRNCNVCFPTYYPDGDYHAFISKDYNYGLFGEPWKQEIYVVGEKLISLFIDNKVALNISEI